MAKTITQSRAKRQQPVWKMAKADLQKCDTNYICNTLTMTPATIHVLRHRHT
eukprot:COSAG01_NODE_426_length_17219_cov_9.275637_6_plen_52_part_00